MNKIDYLSINGKLLRTFVTVYDNASITRAAEQLGLTQSAVSHMIDRLREITADPLFVKSGRNIVPSAQADNLAGQARVLLDQLREFAHHVEFNAENFDEEIVIAAGDLQRDLLLPALFDYLKQSAPKLRLRIIPSDIPGLDLLRDNRCFLVISPHLPDGTDILHRRLFTDYYAVFYDANHRKAPSTLKNYLSAQHVSVRYEEHKMLDIDAYLNGKNIQRDLAVTVTGFAGIKAFIQGSSRLATLPSLLNSSQLKGLQQIKPPFSCPELPMYAIWHQRHQNDPIMRWLLNGLYKIANLPNNHVRNEEPQ